LSWFGSFFLGSVGLKREDRDTNSFRAVLRKRAVSCEILVCSAMEQPWYLDAAQDRLQQDRKCRCVVIPLSCMPSEGIPETPCRFRGVLVG